MSKLVSLSINSQFGILQAQEVEFQEKNGIVEVKAAVGSGKSTAKAATELSLFGTKSMVDSAKYGQDYDLESQILYGKTPVFVRNTSVKGDKKSVLYIKDVDGKKVNNPVIDGRKATPGEFMKLIRTELTFGVDQFLSDNPRVHMEFMMGLYSDKLRAKGVVFDTKSSDYKGSILYRLDQAKLDRADKFLTKRSINGFKESLEAEGWNEENIPSYIDLSGIESEIRELNDKKNTGSSEHFRLVQSNRDRQDLIKEEVNKQKEIITAYNSAVDGKLKLAETDELKRVQDINRALDAKLSLIEELKAVAVKFVDKEVTNDLLLYAESIKLPKREVIKPVKSIPLVPIVDGKIQEEAFTKKYSPEVDEALKVIDKKKIEYMSIGEIQPFDASKIDGQIAVLEAKKEAAKATNLIVNRWNAYLSHSEADYEVKRIFLEYQKIYTSLDLGVPGLKMKIVGDEENQEIRTFYSGDQNPVFFSNPDREDRLLSSYSGTQKPVIAILMQVYLLEEKKRNNEDGLRFMWIECPIDNKTRDLLNKIQDENDLTIVTSITGDFTREGLKDGEFLIEGGILLHKS